MCKIFSICLFIGIAAAFPKLDSTKYPGQVVFLGDSITDFWRQNGWQPWAEFYAPLDAINTGVAGDLTTNTIQRITDNGIIDNLNARLAVLMIGTNDLAWGGLNEQQVFDNIGVILNLIRTTNPGAKTLLLGVFPRVEADIHQKIRNLNELLPRHANGEDVFFLNIESTFATGLGQIIPNLFSDGVHLTSEGYAKWAESMNPTFFAILDDSQLPSTTTTTPKPGQGELVFLGDSITQFWSTEGKPTWDIHYGSIGAINLGVAGDLTSNTIQRINDGIVDNLNAKVAILKIGTNDLSWGVSSEEIISNIGTILDLVKSKNPGVHILLIGILPRAPAETHQRARDINKELAKYGSDEVTFLDLDEAFSHDAGYVYPELYTMDFLHLGPAGYVMWAVQMNPVLFRILNQQRSPGLAH